MDKTTESLDKLAKRLFGSDCRVQTSTGTRIKPGAVTIILADKIIGSAPTFQGALRQAQEELACNVVGNKPELWASGSCL